MKKSKILVVMIAVVLACGLLMSCAAPAGVEESTESTAAATEQATEEETASEEAAAGEALKMGFCPMDLSNPFFAEMAVGAQSYADENNIELTVVDGKSDAQQQVTAVENFISQGVNAIAMVPVDAESLTGIINEAVADGIPVVTHTTLIDGATAYMGIKEHDMGYTIGKVAGQWIAENHPDEEIEYAILNQPTLPQIIEREEGIQDGIAEFAPNAKLATTVAAWLPDMGMDAAENIMQANPDVKVIVGINDSGALGAYETITAMGIADDGDFFIGGVDGSETALEKIKEGGIYRGTVNIKPYETGRQLLTFCQDALEGEEVPAETWVEVSAVTIDNVDDILASLQH